MIIINSVYVVSHRTHPSRNEFDISNVYATLEDAKAAVETHNAPRKYVLLGQNPDEHRFGPVGGYPQTKINRFPLITQEGATVFINKITI